MSKISIDGVVERLKNIIIKINKINKINKIIKFMIIIMH
jgi:hypothetical protein